MHATGRNAALIVLALTASRLAAVDKNGVAPQAISLPSGPGSIQGLGESFQPQLNTGAGSTAVKLALPRGPGGITPDLVLSYNSGGGNGSLGLGWSLAGMLSIRRSTDRGVPFHVDGPDGVDNDADAVIDNPGELDTFTGANGEELVTLGDGSFRAENESSFLRYTRSGGGWEARSRDGRRYLFGSSPTARIEEGGKVFEWCLERVIDPNGNSIDYEYLADPASPAQKHLRRVRWGNTEAYLALVLGYEPGRPDITTSFRSGFAIKTSLRLSGIDVISNGIPAPAAALRADFDGVPGATDVLIRRYRLEYQAGAHLTLLARVTQLGNDGVTALPTLSFAYTPWTPPDEVAATIIRSRNAPAAGFDSGSVEVIDMNGDGLPDLLSTSGNDHRVYVNRGIDEDGRLAWAAGLPVDDAPPIDIASDRTHLADATADGLSDLMVKVSNTSFLCYDNTSLNAWVRAPFPITNTDTWPIWPYDGAGGALSRSFDSDYSRSNDVFHTGQTGYQLWLLLPGGRYSRELRFQPLSVDGQVFRFDLLGAHIADLNGDRLQDFAWIQPSRVVYFPNLGRGSFAGPIILGLGRTLTTADIERSDFCDIDGDGLVDLTVVRPTFQADGVVYWLNRFERGLEGPRTVRGLPAQRSGDALRWADLNGNGTTDIVISQAQSAPGEKILVVDLIPEGKPFLLRTADNGLGRTIRMDYDTSTAQMVRAQAAGTPWATRMPIATTVVGRITEDDGVSPPSVQTITYRDPHYEPTKQEFRGFAAAEAREEGDATAATKRTRLVFDTGRDEACLKGKQLAEETRGEDGKLFRRSATTWSTRVLATGVDGREVCYAFSAGVDQYIHEGEPTGVELRDENEYDDYGNTIVERRLGIVDAPGDEVVIERGYDLRLADWRLDLVSRETTFDGSGKRVAEKRSFYDARGNLERVELWLENEDRFIVDLRQRFDSFGNVIEKINGRQARRSLTYDPLLHAWPTSETVHLGDRDLTMTAAYDLGLGVVTAGTNFAGVATSYSFDALGRLIGKEMPGGAGEAYEYHLSSPVSHVVKRRRDDAQGGTFDTYLYSDGHGRPLLSIIEAEGGRWRCLDGKTYNSRKLEAGTWLPFERGSPSYATLDPALPHDQRAYDVQGRVVETLRADGSMARTEYLPRAEAVHDGNDVAVGGSPDIHHYDGLGRRTAVEERNGAETHITRYAWNARGELESVVDALGNTKRFRFDSLQRLIAVDDPDSGILSFEYDDAGNCLGREDARGQVISYTHDNADRLLEKRYRGAGPGGADHIEATYHYDVAAGEVDFGDGTRGMARNVRGRLAWVEDASGQEHYSYDERGNMEWVLKRIRDPRTGLTFAYRTQRRYDLLDREAEAFVFPDNDRVRTLYSSGSFVSRIHGGDQGEVILAGAAYAPSGQLLHLEFGNGAVSIFEYDPSQRLESQRVLDAGGGELWSQRFSYDAVSSIVAITDERPLADIPAGSPRRTDARFDYDELHRLTRVRYGVGGSGGRIDYTYDALGNLLSQTTPPAGASGHIENPDVGLGTLAYAGGRSGRQGRRPGDPPGPHAATSTASGHRFAYDASGNLNALDGATLRWDFEQRLSRYSRPGIEADYSHDHAGRRVAKRVARGRAHEDTLYVDRCFEVRGGAVAKYVFLDERRVARVEGRLDPARDLVQQAALAAGWNLVAAAVESPARLSDVYGADAAVYEARGMSYAPVSLSTVVPPAKALWIYAPSARLVVLRGALPASASEPSPGPLHAWPVLRPFRPAQDTLGSAPLLIHEAATGRWLRRDAALPAFLSDAPAELGAAQAFWSPEPVTFSSPTAGTASTVFYHQDHLGSTAVISDAAGRMLEERTYYPFGAARSVHHPGGLEPRVDYELTGKERDAESGLVAMGARGYLDLAGVFLSPDPRFNEAARLARGSPEDQRSFTTYLANPQMGNLYAYALRNPLRFVDASGLEVVISPALRDTPAFMKAWKIFQGTSEGQRVLKALEAKGAKVYIRASLPGVKDAKVGSFTTALGQQYTGPAEGKNLKEGEAAVLVNVREHHKSFDKLGRDRLILEFADTIHHELRHAEGDFYRAEQAAYKAAVQSLQDVNKAIGGAPLPANPYAKTNREIHQDLDRYNSPSDDPFNAQFQKEINLVR